MVKNRGWRINCSHTQICCLVYHLQSELVFLGRIHRIHYSPWISFVWLRSDSGQRGRYAFNSPQRLNVIRVYAIVCSSCELPEIVSGDALFRHNLSYYWLNLSPNKTSFLGTFRYILIHTVCVYIYNLNTQMVLIKWLPKKMLGAESSKRTKSQWPCQFGCPINLSKKK